MSIPSSKRSCLSPWSRAQRLPCWMLWTPTDVCSPLSTTFSDMLKSLTPKLRSFWGFSRVMWGGGRKERKSTQMWATEPTRYNWIMHVGMTWIWGAKERSYEAAESFIFSLKNSPGRKPACFLHWGLHIWFLSALINLQRSRWANPFARQWEKRRGWQCTTISWSKWKTTRFQPQHCYVHVAPFHSKRHRWKRQQFKEKARGKRRETKAENSWKNHVNGMAEESECSLQLGEKSFLKIILNH